MRLISICFMLFSFSIFSAEYYEKALTAYEQNKMEDSYIHLKNVLKDDPDNLPAKILMGKVLMFKHYYDDGIAILNEALNQGADINLFINELGNALMIKNSYDKVILLGKNVNLTAASKLTWFLLSGNAYTALKNIEEARDFYQKALTLAPNNERSLAALAAFELDQNNIIIAEKHIEKVLTLFPKQSRIWHLKGKLLERKRDYINALQAFENAHKLNDKDPMVQRALAYAYSNANRIDDALNLIEKILVDTPEDPFAKLLKSQLLVNDNRSEEAKAILADISQKLSLLTDEEKNNNIALVYAAGTAAYLQNDLEFSQKNLAAYLQERPSDIAAVKMLVDIYLRQNQQDKAKVLLESNEDALSENINLALRLANIYLNINKLYKAERILIMLEDKYKHHSQYIITKVNWLAKNGRFDDALVLLLQYKTSEFNPNFELSKGLILSQSEQLTKASSIADDLLFKSPDNINYLSFKGTLLLKQRQWQKAINVFEKILLIQPDQFAAQFNIATALAAMNETSQAKKLAENLLESNTDYIPLHILVAKLVRDSGNIEKAISQLDTLVKANTTNIKAIETLLEFHFSQGNYTDALRQSERLNKLVFLNPKYLAQKAEIHIALKDYLNATKQLNKLYGVVNTAQEYYQLALLQIKAEDFKAGKTSLEHALTLEPNSLLLELELAKLEIELGDLVKVEQTLKKLEKSHNNNPNVLLIRGNLLLKQNKPKQAYKKYLAALNIDNNFNAALVKLYQLTLINIGSESFRSTLTTLLEKNEDNHFMRNLLADHLLNIGHKEEAMAQYLLLNKVDSLPDQSIIFNNLANILIDSDLIAAEQYAQKALALNNTSAAILDTYGWIKSLRGDHQDSLNILRKAFAMDSDNPAINYHLGYTLIKLGRASEAKYELERSLNHKSTFNERADVELLLESIEP